MSSGYFDDMLKLNGFAEKIRMKLSQYNDSPIRSLLWYESFHGISCSEELTSRNLLGEGDAESFPSGATGVTGRPIINFTPQIL